MKKQTSPTQQLLAAVTHVHNRPFKGGTEIRFSNLDKGKETVQNLIKAKEWPIEIFNIDISLRSIAVRELAQSEDRLDPIVHPLTA